MLPATVSSLVARVALAGFGRPVRLVAVAVPAQLTAMEAPKGESHRAPVLSESAEVLLPCLVVIHTCIGGEGSEQVRPKGRGFAVADSPQELGGIVAVCPPPLLLPA
jgi:hypothetical protein